VPFMGRLVDGPLWTRLVDGHLVCVPGRLGSAAALGFQNLMVSGS